MSSDVYFFNAWLMKFPTLSPSSLLLLQKQRNVIFSSHPPHVPALWVFFIFPCGLSLTFWRPEPPYNSCILTPLSLLAGVEWDVVPGFADEPWEQAQEWKEPGSLSDSEEQSCPEDLHIHTETVT